MQAKHDTMPVQHFLGRYKQFSSSWAESRLNTFKMNFTLLKSATQAISNIENKLEEKSANNFNLFQILGVESLEVTTHSAFLGCLFDPEGSHAQGGLFLKSFLNYCHNKFNSDSFPEPPKQIIPEDWDIQIEKVTPFGNMDTVISSKKEKRLIVIENKIYAEEQPRQLARYNDWMAMQDMAYPAMKRSLVYLTIDGREAKTAEGASYHCLAYQFDIQDWLEELIILVKAPRVAMALEQYLQTISEL